MSVSPYALELLAEQGGGGRLIFAHSQKVEWQRWLVGLLPLQARRSWRLRGALALAALEAWLGEIARERRAVPAGSPAALRLEHRSV